MTDGSELAPPGQPTRPSQQRPRTDPTPRDAPRSPNYAARRMLVTTVAITAVVAVAVFGWRLIDDEPGRASGDEVTWSEVVLVDRPTGAVAAIDPAEPDVLAAEAPATARVTAVHAHGDRIALVQAGQITVTGLTDDPPTVIPIELGSTVTRLAVDDSLWLAVGTAAGGNVLLVDGATGAQYDVGALSAQPEPRYFVDTIRFDPDGTRFAIADAASFQTIVVRTDVEPPDTAFFPDQPIAVDGDLVVTSQVVGQRAELTLHNSEGEDLANVASEVPVGGTLVDDDVTFVSNDGTISRFGQDDTETERLGTVAVPAGASIRWVRLTADGTRFVVFGDTFEAVVDLDGSTVFITTFATAVDPPAIDPGWACLPVGGGDTYHSLVDLASGEQLADLTGMAVTSVSADGCTVLGTRAGVIEVVGDGGSVQLLDVRSATLTPDGDAAVVETTAGATQLLDIDDWSLEPPIELTAPVPSNPVVVFR